MIKKFDDVDYVLKAATSHFKRYIKVNKNDTKKREILIDNLINTITNMNENKKVFNKADLKTIQNIENFIPDFEKNTPC